MSEAGQRTFRHGSGVWYSPLVSADGEGLRVDERSASPLFTPIRDDPLVGCAPRQLAHDDALRYVQRRRRWTTPRAFSPKTTKLNNHKRPYKLCQPHKKARGLQELAPNSAAGGGRGTRRPIPVAARGMGCDATEVIPRVLARRRGRAAPTRARGVLTRGAGVLGVARQRHVNQPDQNHRLSAANLTSDNQLIRGVLKRKWMEMEWRWSSQMWREQM